MQTCSRLLSGYIVPPMQRGHDIHGMCSFCGFAGCWWVIFQAEYAVGEKADTVITFLAFLIRFDTPWDYYQTDTSLSLSNLRVIWYQYFRSHFALLPVAFILTALSCKHGNRYQRQRDRNRTLLMLTNEIWLWAWTDCLLILEVVRWVRTYARKT
jgi:hypothetical protein